jgi:hypothetical protein
MSFLLETASCGEYRSSGGELKSGRHRERDEQAEEEKRTG